MIAVLFTLISISFSINENLDGEKNRIINYNNVEVNTTYEVPEHFLGMYEGRKTGYLKLNSDGTGEYKYDMFGLAPASCERTTIQLIWGFILNEKGEIVNNKRDYGLSYPILLESTGSNSFQGCRSVVMKDFILKKGESLHVSSSDDWKKNIN